MMKALRNIVPIKLSYSPNINLILLIAQLPAAFKSDEFFLSNMLVLWSPTSPQNQRKKTLVYSEYALWRKDYEIKTSPNQVTDQTNFTDNSTWLFALL
jgi:hypothetical protein